MRGFVSATSRNAALAAVCVLALGGTSAGGQAAERGGEAGTDPAYRDLFEAGVSYPEFHSAARARRELWQRNRAGAVVPGPLVARARDALAEADGGPWRFLVVASDRCSDSASILPYVAALADSAGVELRVVTPEAGRAVMEAHALPDGRSATPTVVLLDGAYRPVGAWVERPAALVSYLADPARAGLSHDARFDAKMDWYSRDEGRTTVAEVVDLMAAAVRR